MGNKANSKKTARKRGVTASRVKLEKAMLKAGFKTQSALALKIAENENLDVDNPPRDMVNRVFRGVSVDPQTLERVANVLGVSAYTLMLSSNEVFALQTEKGNSPHNVRLAPKFILYGSSAFMLVLIITFVSFNLYSDFFKKTPEDRLSTAKPVDIALIGELPALPDFQQYVSHYLGSEFNIQSSDISPIASTVQPWELAERLSVDYIMDVKFISAGRFQAIIISLFNNNQKQVVYTNAWSKDMLALKMDEIAHHSSQAIQTLLTADKTITASPVYINTIPEKALVAYIRAMDELDKPFTNFFLNQALTHINRALRITPSFVKARAGLCEALVALYVSSKDISLLKEAETECEMVAAVAEDLSEYQYAVAQLYRKQGNLELAVSSFEKAIAGSKHYVKAMMGLAETYIIMASKKQDTEYFSKAIELMSTAETYAPEFWKPSFVRGRAYYFSGDPVSAIEATEKSVSISKYYSNLNNLATMHFCFGDRNRAKQFYLDASLLKHSPPLAQYQLGSIYSSFNQHDLASKAVGRYQQQVRQEGSQVSLDGWIGIGDIYEGNQQLDKAREAYNAAYENGEKLRLNGNNTPALSAKLLYLKLALGRLESTGLSEQDQQDYQAQFSEMQEKINDPNITFLILQAFYQMENWEKVQQLFDLVAPVCKGFADHPDLVRFKKASSEK